VKAATRGAELGGAGRPNVVGFGSGAAGVGQRGGERALTGGAYASVRGEREGNEDGRSESKRKAYFREYAKGPRRPMRGMMVGE
jgi:hypothetical protein